MIIVLSEDSCRQRQRADLERDPELGRRDRHRLALHRARQAAAERLYRELHVWTAPALQGCDEDLAAPGSGAFMYAACWCGPCSWPLALMEFADW